MSRNFRLAEPAVVALQTMRSHKLRSFLMLLGIILSVSTLILVISLIEGTNRYIEQRVANMGSNVFLVTQFGLITNMEDFVKANPWAFADVIPVLWEATKYQGKIYAIPQDSEIRMFFYNKDMLRKIGKDDAFIESIPEKVDSGQMTMADFGQMTKDVVDKGAAAKKILRQDALPQLH